MITWIIEPRDPLIVRDGRPFGPNPGARAKSLSFPFPSTTTGGLRTRSGLDENTGAFKTDLIVALKQIEVRGPLLVELDPTGEVTEWLLPAPADALLLPKDDSSVTSNSAVRHRLVPIQTKETNSNLPDDLALVGLPVTPVKLVKPLKKPPRFWYWKQYLTWLTDPQNESQVTPEVLGHDGPMSEQRMHVKIDPSSFIGEEGFLFQTSGLEFARGDGANGLSTIEQFGQVKRLALALTINTQSKTELSPKAGLAPLGGERRLMQWRESKADWPQLPDKLKTTIVAQGACRLLLLTPAYFRQGFRPSWLLQPQYDVTPELKAAAVAQPQVVSGWDFTLNRSGRPGAPKPTRRLAPAGSVFYLKLNGDKTAIEQWVEAMWLQCVSDDGENEPAGQNRRDGFGLAALGVWTGELQPMEVA